MKRIHSENGRVGSRTESRGAGLRSLRTSSVALLVVLASVVTTATSASAGSGPTLNDSRAILGTGTGSTGASLCPTGDAIVSQSAPVTGGNQDGISWSTGSEPQYPYPPSGVSAPSGGIPYVEITDTSNVTIDGVIVHGGGGGGSAYQFYNATSNSLPPSGTLTSTADGVATTGSAGGYYYTPPTNNGGGSPVLSGVYICVAPSGRTATLSTTPTVSGTSVFDTATVSGITGGTVPTGTVTFTLYSGTPGNGTPVTSYGTDNPTDGSATVTLSGGTATSPSATGLAPGNYYFMVTYSGDGTYSAITPGTVETFAIASVTTTLNPPSGDINVGQSASDSATVSNVTASPSGTVTFTVYTNNTCTTAASGFTSASTPFTGVIGTTNPVSLGTFTTAGTYYVQAVYSSGGPNPTTVSSQCGSEVVTVTTQTPVVATTPSESGTSASDSVTVTGATGGPAPTGTVTFTLYNSSNTVVGTADTEALTSASGSNVASASTTESFSGLAAGSYYFVAVYNGDGTYSSVTGSHEDVTIAQQGPGVATTVFSGGSLVNDVMTGGTVVTGSIGAPASVYDTATVTGVSGGPVPTGSVTFYLFSGTCPLPPSGSVVAEITGALVGQSSGTLVAGVATSGAFGSLAAGSYYFLSSYSGDGTYFSAPGPCEPFTVVSLPPSPPPSTPSASLSTTPTVSGATATDSATVTGTSGTPTGTVTFTLYKGTSGSGTLVSGFAPDTVTLSNGTASSVSTGTLAAGSYYFLVTYSGDSTYSAITPGTAEPFTIIAVSPAKPPKKPTKPTKPTVPPYKIPTKPPKTGFGGSAKMVYDGGLLAGGGSVLLAGLLMMVYALRRRRRL